MAISVKLDETRGFQAVHVNTDIGNVFVASGHPALLVALGGEVVVLHFVFRRDGTLKGVRLGEHHLYVTNRLRNAFLDCVCANPSECAGGCTMPFSSRVLSGK